MLVLEGGWPSASAGGITSSPALQSEYIARQAAILDSADARVWLQITFTDLDTIVVPIPPIFAVNGLVDVNFQPKPALTVWDSIYVEVRSER